LNDEEIKSLRASVAKAGEETDHLYSKMVDLADRGMALEAELDKAKEDLGKMRSHMDEIHDKSLDALRP
tara:strand:+ start:101 stop:307 length:207 start_codon:yes stop_codon:yes gene_type:complete